MRQQGHECDEYLIRGGGEGELKEETLGWK